MKVIYRVKIVSYAYNNKKVRIEVYKCIVRVRITVILIGLGVLEDILLTLVAPI